LALLKLAAEAAGADSSRCDGENISQRRKEAVLRNDEGHLHDSLGVFEAGFDFFESAVSCLR
jgi:hypothetical protein